MARLDSLFEKLDEGKKSTVALESYNDFETFCEFVYGYKFYDKQRLIADAVMNDDLKHILIEAPRGSGKSELVSIAYQSWIIGREHDSRIITVSNSLEQAKLFLAKIDSILRNSEEYREVFGELVPKEREGTLWTSEAKSVTDRSDLKDPTMVALGRQGAIVGRRATIIICDDIIDDDAVLTQYLRTRISDWFWKALYPCLIPNGRMIVIGTRYHEDDIYSELEQKWK